MDPATMALGSSLGVDTGGGGISPSTSLSSGVDANTANTNDLVNDFSFTYSPNTGKTTTQTAIYAGAGVLLVLGLVFLAR